MFEIWMIFVGISMSCGSIPQIVRIWKRKKSEDVSLILWFITLHGLVWWAIYGVCINSLCLVVTNGIGVFLSLALILSIIKFREK